MNRRGPLTGRRIVTTRPTVGDLDRAIERAGGTAGHVPLITIGDPPDGGRALAAALSCLGSFDWLVVTSANGAARVGAAAKEHPGVRLAAVGSATAEVFAAAAGRPVDLVPGVARAAGLLAELSADPPVRLLVAQADRASGELVAGLRAAGHDVEAVIAYATSTRTPREQERRLVADADAVVFASGSAVDGWIEAFGPTGPGIVVAIGPVTAEAVVAAGLPRPLVADRPEPTAVVDLLTVAFCARS